LLEQGGEPGLIEEHLLVRRLPQGTDLLFLAPGGKGLLPHTQGQQRFEMFSFGITLACLPPSDRFARDAQVFGQTRLRQANGRS
jgi:hypothetical protein